MVLLSGCAKAVDVHISTEPSGFWLGLWHGIIVPFTFIGSLIWDSVAVYDINNTGGWYDFGFLLGVGAFSFGTSKSR